MEGEEYGKSLVSSKFESLGVEERGKRSRLRSTTTRGESLDRMRLETTLELTGL